MTTLRLAIVAAVALVAALLVSGCTLTTPLTHPAGGDVWQCRGWGKGVIGFPLAWASQKGCVAEGERLGLIAGKTSVTVSSDPPRPIPANSFFKILFPEPRDWGRRP